MVGFTRAGWLVWATRSPCSVTSCVCYPEPTHASDWCSFLQPHASPQPSSSSSSNERHPPIKGAAQHPSSDPLPQPGGRRQTSGQHRHLLRFKRGLREAPEERRRVRPLSPAQSRPGRGGEDEDRAAGGGEQVPGGSGDRVDEAKGVLPRREASASRDDVGRSSIGRGGEGATRQSQTDG